MSTMVTTAKTTLLRKNKAMITNEANFELFDSTKPGSPASSMMMTPFPRANKDFSKMLGKVGGGGMENEVTTFVQLPHLTRMLSSVGTIFHRGCLLKTRVLSVATTPNTESATTMSTANEIDESKK